MKTRILTLIAIFALTVAVAARSKDKITLRAGQQKTIAQGELTIKFISVVEDSRCPADARCIWAGNAKIKIAVTDKRGRSKVMEVNTNLEPRGERFGGYAINLSGLTPEPTGRGAASKYVATLTIERLLK